MRILSPDEGRKSYPPLRSILIQVRPQANSPQQPCEIPSIGGAKMPYTFSPPSSSKPTA